MGIRQGVSGKYRRSLGSGAKPKIRGPGRREAAGHLRLLSSQEKTARTKLFARIDSLRTSSGPDRCCMYSRSFFAALGLCARHEKVPPQHLASRYHRDRPRIVKKYRGTAASADLEFSVVRSDGCHYIREAPRSHFARMRWLKSCSIGSVS